MSAQIDLETLVHHAIDALKDATGEASPAETNFRDRFFELMVVILGNLYTKTPVAGPLYDRVTLLRVTTGMDDADAGRLTQRTEDWLRLEGLLRQQDGTKNYFITRQSMAVLSTLTQEGALGEVFEKVLQRYQAGMPSESLRRAARLLSSYFLTRIARS